MKGDNFKLISKCLSKLYFLQSIDLHSAEGLRSKSFQRTCAKITDQKSGKICEIEEDKLNYITVRFESP